MHSVQTYRMSASESHAVCHCDGLCSRAAGRCTLPHNRRRRREFRSSGRHGSGAGGPHRAGRGPLDRRGDMAGCVVLVGRRAGIVFEKAYGNRSVEPEDVPMTTDTVFDMASLTKPVGHGHERDDPRRARPTAAPGQGGQVLSRVCGQRQRRRHDRAIARALRGPDSRQFARRLRRWLEVGEAEDLRFEAARRAGHRSSSTPTSASSCSARSSRSVTGKPVNEFAKEEIFEKLGMNETGYLPSDELKARAATTEKRDGEWLDGRGARSAGGEDGRRRRARRPVQHGRRTWPSTRK